jgi:hypothetical protein
MKKTLLFLTFTFFLLIILNFNSFAQLATYNFTTVDTNPTSVDGNITATALSVSSGTIAYQASPSNINVSSWSTSATYSAAGKYYQISVSPKSNFKMSVTGFSFSAGRTSAGPATIDVLYSLDGFSTTGTQIGTFNNTNTSTLTSFSSPAFSVADITTTITFRIFGYNASSTGNFRINNISVLGASTTLPIFLTSFTGKPVDKSILLNWTTASETNNDYFEVLKSTNGKTFTAVGTVKGNGTTKDAKSYSLVDDNPASGANYYQLVQHDFDGKSSKSDIIPVNSAVASSSLTVYAAVSSVDVSINSANQTDGSLQIFDLAGKKLNETRLTLTKGFNTLSLPLSLNSGIYVVSFVSEAEVINSKFIKE